MVEDLDRYYIPLGPFMLSAPLGRGGMGEVWEGIHRTEQVQVAVKVMTLRASRREEFRKAFGAEVQAAARLHHPHIIHVFDYGEVSAETEELSATRLAAGSPYLVMELAVGGSLKDLGMPRDWHEFRTNLLQILDALAHAHARGVIHRDIKPGNVLFGHEEDGRHLLKLSDFGIARAVEGNTRAGNRDSNAAGTPHYMAPEQIHGLWRDQGPWTDLYSVGCMAVQLLTGYPPFYQHGQTIVQVVRHHMYTPVPVVTPVIAVPEGFQGWVERLLRKSPHDRYQRAADAAFDLLALGDPASDMPVDDPGFETQQMPMNTRMMQQERGLSMQAAAELKVTVSLPAAGWTQSLRLNADGFPVRARLEEDDSAHDKPYPPVPLTWKRPQVPRRSMRLVGAGLGLFGIRTIPLTGREAERTMLWNALRKVSRSDRGRLLLVRGGAGVGKTRLTQWFAERAHEVGAATLLKATHTQEGSRGDGIARMLARHMQCVGLRREYIYDRVEAQLSELVGHTADPADVAALVEVMAPSLSPDEAEDIPRMRFSSAEERYVVVRRFIEQLCPRRPVVLWLDDLQWSSDSIGFAEHMMRSQRLSPQPVLIVAVVRDDVLEEQDLEARQIEQLVQVEGTYELELDPLIPEAHLALVRSILGLEGKLAEEVAQRTQGRPLFAVQLIGDWVERGVLEVGREGFRLRDGESIHVPDDLHSVFSARIDALAARLGRDAMERAAVHEALEVAAVLGTSVDEEEWRLACRWLEVAGVAGLVEELVRHRLAVRTETGWDFAEVMLVESLGRTAREAGRWSRIHAMCGRVLHERHGDDDPTAAHRIALHLLVAGDVPNGTELALAAAEMSMGAGDLYQAHVGLTRCGESLDGLGVHADDPRRIRLWMTLARACQELGELRAADAALAQVPLDLQRSMLPGAELLGAELLELRGKSHELRGDLDAAIASYEAAMDVYTGTSGSHHVARCLVSLGSGLRLLGDLEAAQRYFESAVALLGDASRDNLLGFALNGIGTILTATRRFEEAEQMLVRGISHFQSSGHRAGLASCLNSMGGLAMIQGQFEEAEDYLVKSLQLGESIGYRETPEFRVDLGVVHLARGRYGEAWQTFEVARAEFEEAGQRGMLGVAHGGLMASTAAHRDWAAFEAHAAAAMPLLLESGLVHDYLAWVLELAGDMAVAGGRADLARRAYELSVAQYQALNMSANVDAVVDKLSRPVNAS